MILQSQRQALRPVTTAHLAQTMTLMGLTAAELQQKIKSALAANPALELAEKRYCPTCHRRWQATRPAPSAAGLKDQLRVSRSFMSRRAKISIPHAERLYRVICREKT